ncbi:hypothetical protein VSDG_04340 [Cytospora chrysosperma]|uniref:SLC26A/SulP transporter domain-containing protein n=1 Tax=Cytospora chrysosperma TaxID=252740 RepID=A0A423W5L3_CYTCH|nr:hypothetical protein VSDG_04340 [Valsa sordida]
MAFKDLANLQRHNVRTLRNQPLAEISGALGDLGTLLPLMIALALQGSISLPSTLVFSGLFNIATGIFFGIPLPVQPMKAIAAAAIASHASQEDTLAAGALVASAVLILSATGLLRLLTVYIPVPVVKGIQFGAGLSLVISAGTGMLVPLGWAHNPFDNRIWALAAFLLLIFTARTPRRFPYALIVFATGLVLSIAAIVTGDKDTTGGGGPGPSRGGHLPGWEIWRPSTAMPAWGSSAAWSMAAAQLPLTTLNSVIAAAALASDLMGPGFPAPGVTALGASVAAMNLLGCWFGAMPVCHGAGGLAAQHRFGARSGASVVLLGAAKLLLGLLLGASLLDLLRAFPRSVLGVMVVAAGLELARVGQSLNHGAPDLWEESVLASSDSGGGVLGGAGKRHRDVSDEERQERWSVMLVTTAGILAFKNDAVGFVAGMLTYWAYRLSHAVERHRGSVGGSGERQPLLRCS